VRLIAYFLNFTDAKIRVFAQFLRKCAFFIGGGKIKTAIPLCQIKVKHHASAPNFINFILNRYQFFIVVFEGAKIAFLFCLAQNKNPLLNVWFGGGFFVVFGCLYASRQNNKKASRVKKPQLAIII
jgi:hypothetical protein